MADLIDDAVTTSRMYWIAAIIVGVILICIEAYRKRWSVILALTIALLIFHPHLTIQHFPMPSCEFVSIEASQAVILVLLAMFGYRIVTTVLARRKSRVLRAQHYDPTKFRQGSKVRVADRAILEEFLRTWKYHHKLQAEQLEHAGKIARVKNSGMYHGGAILYELEDLPGTWHECCLEAVQETQ
jgi:hypothetical protein